VLFGSTVTVTATVAGAGSGYSIVWLNHGSPFAITTTNTITYVKLAGIDTITAVVASHSIMGCYDSVTSAEVVVTGTPIVGVNGVATNWNVHLYPNPAGSNVALSGLPVDGSIAISTMTGQTVLRREIANTTEKVDVSSFAPGIYTVLVTDKQGSRAVMRMVKQ
jgi:hypothetical protein